MSTGKLIFFDIDNTLVSHVGRSHIPEATREALRLLRRGGHVTAIATARNLCMTRRTAADLAIDLMVCCDGAHGVQDGKTLYEECLSPAFLQKFQEGMSREPENFFALDAEYVYVGWTSKEVEDYLVAQAGFDCRRPPADLRSASVAYMFRPSSLQPGRRDDVDIVEASAIPGCTEFLPRGVSKWSGILKAAEGLGFGRADIITVGDGLNDVEMIQSASVGVAVGAAKEQVKAVADLVVGDIDEGGILEAFQRLDMLQGG
ncbi:MAG: Cof-type HAD-IIB family hydrolase [Synergistaceae bacterium]|jgi:HAD superfamily hydrolase (TIGR01484 family)|nr:Cof-type HAD-IIB family hydrolase [Synergistaceae bacterium]